MDQIMQHVDAERSVLPWYHTNRKLQPIRFRRSEPQYLSVETVFPPLIRNFW